MPKGKGYGKARSKFVPKNNRSKKKRKPLKGTGGALAARGGSVKAAFKKMEPLRKKKGR